MTARWKILVVLGTRPEAIKLAPLVQALRAAPERFEVQLCSTGQHRELLRQSLSVFELSPDVALGETPEGRSLPELTAHILKGLPAVLEAFAPDLVVVQGDTTSTFAAALAAFYARVPVAHLEAGLRSYNRAAPFPEEINRTFVSRLAQLHFAPTESARQNLIHESIGADDILLSGNTVLDALRLALPQARAISGVPGFTAHRSRRLVLATAHRRESFGAGIERICDALADLARSRDDVEIVFPVHANPAVSAAVRARLGALPRVHLLGPLGYVEFLWLLDRAFFVITDSGGIQEEAPSLGKPVLVAREVTERAELVEAGGARLVGTKAQQIADAARTLLDDDATYRRMANISNPFGDGHASERIAEFLAQRLPRLTRT